MLNFVKWCYTVFLVKRFFCQLLFASAEKLPSDTVLVQFFFPSQTLSQDLKENTKSAGSALKVLTMSMDCVIADRMLQNGTYFLILMEKKKHLSSLLTPESNSSKLNIFILVNI